MKLSKKHILLGSICLTSAILSNVPVVCAIIPYLAFCLCSFALMNGKKAIGTVTVLLIGFVGLPLFKFVYSMLTVSFMTTPIANVLVLLVHTGIYFGLFILINSWIRKEKFAFSLTMGILTVICIAIYCAVEGLRTFALFSAMNQAMEQGTLINWLNVIDGGNIFVSIISELAFFAALWCVSIRFIKKDQ